MVNNLSYKKAPIPKDEKDRLESLYRLDVLNTPPEKRFDRITKLALHFFNVPISTVTLVDSKKEWFKSCQGLPDREGERSISFCGHAILADDIFIIPDTKKDSRFSGNPMVVGKPHIRFYAAVPLKSSDGRKVGAFCIKDNKPRQLDQVEISLLKTLGKWVELELNVHEVSQALEARRLAEAKVSELNKVLRLLNQILRHDILNNIAVIKGYLEFYLVKGKGKKNLDVSDVLATVDRSIKLIRQMGQLETAVSSGVSLKPYKIKEIIVGVSKRFSPIKFNIVGDEVVLADEALVSVTENIIRNAKIHGKTDKIDVFINEKNNFIEIKVADYGVGIPDRVKNKLFYEGFKYGANGHTGLGLYIVKKTIERYGGEIKVADNKPKGAVFMIKLQKPNE